MARAIFAFLFFLVLIGAGSIWKLTSEAPVTNTYYSDRWYEGKSDLSAAISEAQTNSAPLLLYFYTDWCPHCKRFQNTILSDSEVNRALKHVVKIRVNPETGSADRNFMDGLGANGYPTTFVMDPGSNSYRLIPHWSRHDLLVQLGVDGLD